MRREARARDRINYPHCPPISPFHERLKALLHSDNGQSYRQANADGEKLAHPSTTQLIHIPTLGTAPLLRSAKFELRVREREGQYDTSIYEFRMSPSGAYIPRWNGKIRPLSKMTFVMEAFIRTVLYILVLSIRTELQNICARIMTEVQDGECWRIMKETCDQLWTDGVQLLDRKRQTYFTSFCLVSQSRCLFVSATSCDRNG